MRVLVTGATGYIGGRLVPRLLERGDTVRVLARDRARVLDRPWSNRVEIVEGDLLDPASLRAACTGMEAAFYLVHSMCSGDDFAERDRQAATNFVNAARGLRHVVYLGGLVPPRTPGTSTSEHLASRAEVGSILREGLPATDIRAGPIIGSGSASFEMVRYLTERLPAMIAPRWILNPVQPIAVQDIVEYLLAAVGNTDSIGVVEIGSESLTFKQMMQGYAAVRGLRRFILPVPVLAPRLAGLWVGLVTPIPNCIAVPLIEGVERPLSADTARARLLFPHVTPMPYRTAVARALDASNRADVQTRWSDAVGASETVTLVDREGIIRETRTRFVDAPPDVVFRAFSTLGGDRGWLVWNWAWEIRGLIDRIAGGPGLRRGRRHPTILRPGDAVDFWRVESVHPPDLLRLRAEMKVPGRAWLQFQTAAENGGCRLVQTAFFAPVGLSGTLYWYALYPVHALIFNGLVKAIARSAESG